MGRERLAVTLGTRTMLWDLIVTGIGEDESIMGNDFRMAYRLTIRPHEGGRVPAGGPKDEVIRLVRSAAQCLTKSER